MADTEIPIWGWQLQDYINTSSSAASPSYLNVTSLLSWEFADDQKTYEPDYLDTQKKSKYITGSSASIDYEKDAYSNNALDTFLMAHEDDSNIPVEVVRVREWETVEGGGYKAKKAAFLLTPNQLDKNSSGEPIKLKGSLTMADAGWTSGTFKDGTFTADTPAG